MHADEGVDGGRSIRRRSVAPVLFDFSTLGNKSTETASGTTAGSAQSATVHPNDATSPTAGFPPEAIDVPLSEWTEVLLHMAQVTFTDTPNLTVSQASENSKHDVDKDDNARERKWENAWRIVRFKSEKGKTVVVEPQDDDWEMVATDGEEEDD